MENKYRGIELIMSGIVATVILIGFNYVIPTSSCNANITKWYRIFFAVMQVIIIISTCYGIYTFAKNFLSSYKGHKKKKR